MANTRYKLSDASKMMKSLSSGKNLTDQIDANNDGRKDKTDVETMMKIAAGWDIDAAMDPYKGKEVTPDQYGDTQAYLLGKVANRQPFSFSGGGQLFDAYAKAYKREGDLAAKDTLSKLSARTGGVPSSYAVTATAAQQNQYAAELADKVPELYEMELNKYYNDAELDRADLSTLMGVKAQDTSDAYNAGNIGDYRLLEEMGIDTTKLKEDDAWEDALKKAEYGDYSGLTALGVDTSKLLDEYAWNEALTKAEYGDYSGLAALGVDTTKLASDYAWEEALRKAEYGDYSGLTSLGVDTSKLASEYVWDEALRKAEYGDYSGLSALGVDTSFLERQQQAQIGSLTGSGSSSGGGSGNSLSLSDYGDIMDNIEYRLEYNKSGEIVDTSKAEAYVALLVNNGILSATEGYAMLEPYVSVYTSDRTGWSDEQFAEYYGAIAEEGPGAAEAEIGKDVEDGLINVAQAAKYLKMIRDI